MVKVTQNPEMKVEMEESYVFDGSSDSNTRVISHAHADHFGGSNGKAVTSETTAEIAEARFDTAIEPVSHQNVELIDSGHVLGSKAALVEGNKRVLYTGDFSTQDRLYLDGMDPVNADVLIMESTYGIEFYDIPDQQKVVQDVKSWMKSTEDPVFLFGYSFGKAQKLNYIVNKYTDRDVYVHGSVGSVNEVVDENTDLDLSWSSYSGDKVFDSNDAVIMPSRVSDSDWVNKKVQEFGGVKAGFSGWAIDDSFKFRGGYDRTFPLSDHAGFYELIDFVEAVDPDTIYTYHGFDSELASELSRRGFEATALAKNQSRLDQF